MHEPAEFSTQISEEKAPVPIKSFVVSEQTHGKFLMPETILQQHQLRELTTRSIKTAYLETVDLFEAISENGVIPTVSPRRKPHLSEQGGRPHGERTSFAALKTLSDIRSLIQKHDRITAESQQHILLHTAWMERYFKMKWNSLSERSQTVLGQSSYDRFMNIFNEIREVVKEKTWKHVESIDPDTVLKSIRDAAHTKAQKIRIDHPELSSQEMRVQLHQILVEQRQALQEVVVQQVHAFAEGYVSVWMEMKKVSTIESQTLDDYFIEKAFFSVGCGLDIESLGVNKVFAAIKETHNEIVEFLREMNYDPNLGLDTQGVFDKVLSAFVFDNKMQISHRISGNIHMVISSPITGIHINCAHPGEFQALTGQDVTETLGICEVLKRVTLKGIRRNYQLPVTVVYDASLNQPHTKGITQEKKLAYSVSMHEEGHVLMSPALLNQESFLAQNREKIPNWLQKGTISNLSPTLQRNMEVTRRGAVRYLLTSIRDEVQAFTREPESNATETQEYLKNGYIEGYIGDIARWYDKRIGAANGTPDEVTQLTTIKEQDLAILRKESVIVLRQLSQAIDSLLFLFENYHPEDAREIVSNYLRFCTVGELLNLDRFLRRSAKIDEQKAGDRVSEIIEIALKVQNQSIETVFNRQQLEFIRKQLSIYSEDGWKILFKLLSQGIKLNNVVLAPEYIDKLHKIRSTLQAKNEAYSQHLITRAQFG